MIINTASSWVKLFFCTLEIFLTDIGHNTFLFEASPLAEGQKPCRPKTSALQWRLAAAACQKN
jgi:hypothetical protein